nr:MAG TPA: recombination endonuclease VII [Caudoviricetes sp.]
MYVLNKKSGVITECNNLDVIRQCRQDKDYEVGESAEALAHTPEEKTPDAATDTPTEVVPEVPNMPEDYEHMGVKELRNVAKAKGVQGYVNMDKETLIEVIKAHE